MVLGLKESALKLRTACRLDTTRQLNVRNDPKASCSQSHLLSVNFPGMSQDSRIVTSTLRETLGPNSSSSPDVPSDAHIHSEGPVARTIVKSDFDVICYVKRYASDESVSQKPLLALPHAFLSRLPAALPTGQRALAPLSLKRRKEWLALAQELFRRKRFSSGSIRYLLKAAEGGTIVVEDEVPLPWHCADHEHGIVRLEDAPPNTFLKLFPVARFKATLRR